MNLLTEIYKDNISFTLNCFDRIVINGILPELSYSQGITGYLYQNIILIFDFILQNLTKSLLESSLNLKDILRFKIFIKSQIQPQYLHIRQKEVQASAKTGFEIL